MNELVVPPAPHWYKNSVVACSPDNTLVYGSKNDIVVIKDTNPGKPANIQLIHGAHSKHVTSVGLNLKWKGPHSYAVSLGEDNILKVWDVETLEKKTTNKDHTEHKEVVIGAVFAGDDRVVSATASGLVYIWNINTNESKPLNDLFKSKITLTCLSSCPHVGWLVAFGLSNGCVVVADLRKNGRVLYKLRGHYQSVVSLSWCPAPINIFPQSVNNQVKNKSVDGSPGSSGAKGPSSKKENNPWAALVNGDSKETSDLAPPDIQDFLKECDDLKKKILGLEKEGTKSESKDETTSDNVENEDIQPQENETETSKIDESLNEESRDEVQNRPMPQLFDPSGDFLDDLHFEPNLEATKDQNKSDLQESSKEDSLVRKELDKIEGKSGEQDQDHLEPVAKNIEQNTEDASIINAAPPPQEEIFEEEPRTEYLLASSGKDRSVYIWRAGTDGRMQTFFYATKKASRRDKHSNDWIALCWATPDSIITSSSTGEVITWSVPKPRESKKQYTVLHYEHSSHVFNIVTPPKYKTAYNWRDKSDLNIWTWGQEGKLINYDVTNEKILYSFLTVTAVVTSLASSVLDPNRLAVGLRDGNIHVWDLSFPHSNNVSMQKFHHKFTHKVSAIQWNPLKEMILGFGTEEGRVGFVDLLSKKTTLFPHYFRNQVYKIEWGPINGDTHNLGLYAVAEGKMAIYNIQKPSEDPVIIDLPTKLFAYNFAWKPDFTLLLVNGKDGRLIILNPDLTAVSTVYPNEKGLNAIVWHPDAFTNETEISRRCNWFAAATSKGVIILDCSSMGKGDNFADKFVAVFEGHLRPSLALAWCPFEGNKIVSLAADGLAHVWDVELKSAVATIVVSYVSPYCSVAWSPIDADLVIIGDKVIRICRVSTNPPKIDEEFMASRKRLLNKLAIKEPEKTEKTKVKGDTRSKLKTTSRTNIVPPLYVSSDENVASQIANMRKLLSTETTEEAPDVSASLDPLKIFGTKEDVGDLLDQSYLQYKKDSKYKSCELVSLWKGNIGEYIRNAINENRVTPTIVTLAPMVSPKLWHDACLSYALKLSEEENSDPLETAMYFLACHKVEEAINHLCLNFMFKEALALSKQRFPEDSEIINKVLDHWAMYCTTTGNFENAAYCHLAKKDLENAAKVLSRRNQKEFLGFAAELAEKSGNIELYESIKFKCNEFTHSDKVGTGTEAEFPSRVDVVLNANAESVDSKSCSPMKNHSDNGNQSSEQIDNDVQHTDNDIANHTEETTVLQNVVCVKVDADIVHHTDNVTEEEQVGVALVQNGKAVEEEPVHVDVADTV